MLGIFSSLKVWLFVGAIGLAGLGYAAHLFIVKQKDVAISDLTTTVENLQKENVALNIAKQTQDDTIKQLEENNVKQNIAVQELTIQIQTYERQRDERTEIFDNHDFTKLSRAKPGLIEKRARAATQDVFDEIQRDTQEIWSLETNEYKRPPGVTVKPDSTE